MRLFWLVSSVQSVMEEEKVDYHFLTYTRRLLHPHPDVSDGPITAEVH